MVCYIYSITQQKRKARQRLLGNLKTYVVVVLSFPCVENEVSRESLKMKYQLLGNHYLLMVCYVLLHSRKGKNSSAG
jgi:hypothetical protein